MPSLINELALMEIKRMVDASPSLVLIDAAGLKAADSLALRRRLFDVGATMRVAKARLVRRALAGEVAALADGPGSLGLVCGEDIAAAAKIIRELAKEEKLAVRGGICEGSALDAGGALRLADLPSKDEARALVTRAIRMPLVRLARLLKTPYRRLGRAVAAHKEKLEEGS